MSDAPQISAVKVTRVHWWVPGQLFTIYTTKPEGFSYQPGQFARVGMDTQGAGQADMWRAYSMVNGPEADELQFYVIVVPEGEFSPRLAQMQEGDTLYIDHTVFGYLTLERFPEGGKTLWLLATGTGLSAYMGIMEDERTWARFEHVVLLHGVRHVKELTYTDEIAAIDARYPGRFTYLPAPTRDELPGVPQGRIPALLADGRLIEYAARPLNPETDCVMLCGNPDMLSDARKYLQDNGFKPERRGVPGNLAVEKYW